jgi:hypothetical protein
MTVKATVLLVAVLSGETCWADAYQVTNTDDSGPGSLRWAINQADGNPGSDSITFEAGLIGGAIRPTTPLPAITDSGTTINGDIDADGKPDIRLLGDFVSSGDGLVIDGAQDCTIAGLVINRFPQYGIRLNEADGNTIRSCHVGVNRPGVQEEPNGTSALMPITFGEILLQESDDNRIGGPGARRNVIGTGFTPPGSTCGFWESCGIRVRDSSGNRISGNHIGVTRDGTATLGNTNRYGICLLAQTGACTGNTVGGKLPTRRGRLGGGRNLIAGVKSALILDGACRNTILGNWFGLAVDGDTLLPIEKWIIYAWRAADANQIGGTDPAERNVFAGNAYTGIQIDGDDTTGTKVQGNYFGLNATGTAGRPVTWGVYVGANTGHQFIGGDTPATGNYFSAVSSESIGIWLVQNSGSIVRHNNFGTGPSGQKLKCPGLAIGVGHSRVTITDNAIRGNAPGPNSWFTMGIRVGGADAYPRIFRNTFANCSDGVILDQDARANLGNLRNMRKGDDGGNNFRPSNNWHITNITPNRVMAEGNSFGTTVASEIDAKIYDRLDDPSKGRVDFKPLAGGFMPTGALGNALAISSLAASPTAAGAEIAFTLSSVAQVHARVLNIAGRPIKTLCHANECEAGTNTLLWNAMSDQGLVVPNGMCLVEVTASTEDGGQARALAQVRLNR